jgi:hypothetical protein
VGLGSQPLIPCVRMCVCVRVCVCVVCVRVGAGAAAAAGPDGNGAAGGLMVRPEHGCQCQLRRH